jgi:hypothetical protein
MKRKLLAIILGTITLTASTVYSTNGDNMIAIGPIARGMGGGSLDRKSTGCDQCRFRQSCGHVFF